MDFERDKVKIPLWGIWVGVIVAAIIVLNVVYVFVPNQDEKMIGLLGGVVSGLLVYLATFVTAIRPLQELDRYKFMGVKALLANRHDKAYYEKLLVGAKDRVEVMGASCSRFVDDFLDIKADEKVLVDALRSNSRLKVRLLIPTAEHMTPEALGRATGLEAKIKALESEFRDRVALRRFNAPAQHSFVVADNGLVAGPVFDGDTSRHAPAVHVDLNTEFARKYLDYFDSVWAASDAQ